MTETPLLGARLALEPMMARHAELLYPGLSDAQLYAFIPQEPPESVAALEERYRMLESRSSPDGSQRWLNWAARLEASPNVYVGRFEATVLADGRALIAYIVFREHAGHGYAQEGVRVMLEQLRQAFGARLARAEIDTENIASIRVVEKLGFRRVSTAIAADTFKGRVSDEARFERILGV